MATTKQKGLILHLLLSRGLAADKITPEHLAWGVLPESQREHIGKPLAGALTSLSSRQVTAVVDRLRRPRLVYATHRSESTLVSGSPADLHQIAVYLRCEHLVAEGASGFDLPHGATEVPLAWAARKAGALLIEAQDADEDSAA